MSQLLITNRLYIYICVCVCVCLYPYPLHPSISPINSVSLENLEGSFVTTGLVFSMARGYVMSLWVISDLMICQLMWL